MCRHLAWLGEPRSIASLMLDPSHGLLTQSYAPRRQIRGTMNADGWGVGFYPEPESGEPQAPRRWRSAKPLWGDASFASVAPVLVSGAFLGAVRSATVGMPMDESAAAPFTDGHRLLSHNGRIDRAALRTDLSAESVCDAAMFAAMIFDGPGADEDPGVFARHVARTVLEVAERDSTASLNLLIHDGSRITGVTWADPACYRLEPDGVVVASEPLDDEPGWVDVEDRQLIEITREGVSITPVTDVAERTPQ